MEDEILSSVAKRVELEDIQFNKIRQMQRGQHMWKQSKTDLG